MKKIKFSFNSEVEKIIKKFSLNNDWNKNINQDIDKYKSKKFNKKSFNRKDRPGKPILNFVYFTNELYTIRIFFYN